MGINVIAKNITAEDTAVYYSTQVNQGLEGLFFTTGNKTRLAKNYAKDKADATVIGSPAITEQSTKFKSLVNYVQTEIKTTPLMTILFVAKSDSQTAASADRGVFISEYDNPQAIKGLHVGTTANSVSVFYPKADGTLGSLVVAVTHSTANYKLYALRLSATSVDLSCITDNISNAATVSTAERAVAGRKLRIGSDASSFSGNSDITATRIHSVALSDSELSIAADDLRRYAASKGVVV
ncbi:hypothetical protein I3252_05540 [Psychrobacter sp. Ps4]|uniref:hypothetical protein n=1 Tax=Psychrobacter sp. Ps4 TaxID=2790958 RepID=UPI001EE03507|nr:hypothetical protein [Psychrobacter sp. Ps4]MCG3808947.1 hypothetical protein [Psychrobacter sp. Ps4]